MKVLDLFSGIGGFSLGLERAGMETVAFCEFDEHARKVLQKHWPDVPIHNDVRELDGTEYRGTVDVVCGGFPCQDISIAGKNAGINGERSGLWCEFKRIIDEARPRYAIIENVSALLGRGLSQVLQDLAEIGYDAAWTTYDSQFFGVPQRRRRVYIVAVRDGISTDADIFEINKRSTKECRQQVEYHKESRRGDIAPRKGKRQGFAFFTRQRSDEFNQCGLSGTLAKRDYKSFTDLVIGPDNELRRVTPRERLLLQGFESSWLDGLDLTDKQKFSFNGMTVNVVDYIGRLIYEI